MSLPDYEYKGLMAESWDVLRGDTSQSSDRLFFLALIQRFGQPVLDVGCGTGRLLLDFLGQGIDIDGVDNSPDMLALCRHKATTRGVVATVYEQYVETLCLPRQYRTIIIPSSTFNLIIDPAMAVQTAQQLFTHLVPGGVVVAPVMTVWTAGDPLTRQWEQIAVRASDGATFRRMGQYWYDPVRECTDTEDRYQVLVDDQVVAEEVHRRSPALRSYTPAQAQAVFACAGYDRVELYRESTFERADTGDTVVGHKAGG